jgi:hypothetical protein
MIAVKKWDDAEGLLARVEIVMFNDLNANANADPQKIGQNFSISWVEWSKRSRLKPTWSASWRHGDMATLLEPHQTSRSQKDE